MSAYREWRERVAKALGKPPLPPEVREAQRVYEQDVVEFWDDRKAGDQAAIDRNRLYESELTAAECRAGIHDGCVHEEAHDDTEYMSPMGYAAEPVGVVWGTVNPDGSVTSRGFTHHENYRDDSAVHPAGSLVAYHAEDGTWVHMATGQTVAKQREIDAAREEEPPVNQVEHSSSLWWLDGKDTSKMSFNEVTELAIRAGNLRDEMQRQGDPPERIAEVDREYQRLCEAQRAAGQRMRERRESSQRGNDGSKDNASTTTSAPTAGAATSGGSGMSHASEGNAQIQQAGQDIESANGAIQEIVNQLTQAQQNLMGAADESQHAEADTAKAALEQAITTANELQQQVGAAKQAVEDVRL